MSNVVDILVQFGWTMSVLFLMLAWRAFTLQKEFGYFPKMQIFRVALFIYWAWLYIMVFTGAEWFVAIQRLLFRIAIFVFVVEEIVYYNLIQQGLRDAIQVRLKADEADTLEDNDGD